jgi:integrase
MKFIHISHKIIPRLPQGEHFDKKTPGLVIIVSASHDTPPRFVFQFFKPLTGQIDRIDIGSSANMSLGIARKLTRNYSHRLLMGHDPISESTTGTGFEISFKEASKDFIGRKSIEWTNAKHRGQWYATLEQYAWPVIGDMPVSQISRQHLLKILDPIWLIKTETARRVRQRIHAVLDWCKAHGYREGDNPADLKSGVGQLLPNTIKFQEIKHHAAVPWQKAPDLYGVLRSNTTCAHLATEFLLLTSVRTHEALRAKWLEIDFDAQVWTIPSYRTKTKRLQRVPLVARSVEILKTMRQRNSEWVFSHDKDHSVPLSLEACRNLLKGLSGYDEYTPHGFRSTFRDWASECTSFPNEALELCLGHAIANAAEASYRRQDQLAKRFEIMQTWENYLLGKIKFDLQLQRLMSMGQVAPLGFKSL